MYIDVHLASRPSLTTASSLAEIRHFLQADQTIPASRRRDMSSALATVAKALDRPLDAIKANPAELRTALARLTPAMVGLKPGRWRNVHSLLGAALAHFGIVKVQSRLRDKPSAAWMAILPLLGTGVGKRFHLARFARYCSQAGVEPEAVDDGIILRYERDLTEHSLSAEPKRAAREVARAWNAARATHPAWPQQALTVPDNRRIFAPDWGAYPASLTGATETMIARLTDRSPFTDRPGKPHKPASIASLRRHLRAYLGALVQSGIPPEQLVDLAAVVTPERAAIALNYFWEKAGEKPTVYLYKHMSIVLMIARHHARLPPEKIKELEAMVPHLKPEGGRITERNVGRLRQLDDPAKMQALLELPGRLLAKAKRLGAPSVQTAYEVQTAVMIEILLHLPMRLGNLRGLRLGVHVLHDSRGVIRIVVPESEVKNGTPIDAQLSKATSAMVATYIDTFRPLLAKGSDYLIPGGKADRPKSDQGTRAQIQRALADHVGIAFHPHAFRHLAAYMILNDNPQAHGLVQRILGHRSLHATMTFYSGLESGAAIAHLDALIARKREPGGTGKTNRSRGAR
jgi:integrase